MAYYATQHLFVRAIVEAGITFPASKEELIKKFGDLTYRENPDSEKLAAETVKELPLDYYHNGSEFWSAFAAYQAAASASNGL